MAADPPNVETIQVVRETLSRKIEEKDIDIPLLPDTSIRIIQLTQDPDSDAAALANLIHSDQTVAAHVMRVANSAAYSPSSTMVSLQQAIARLGMQAITEIALATSVNAKLFHAPGLEDHIRYEIRYSLASALWAKEVARTVRKNVEVSFLAGLFHDIGRPVVVQEAVGIAKTKGLKLSTNDVLILEDEFQRSVSVAVVELWKLPQAVQTVVEFVDRYEAPHANKDQTMIVVAGETIAGHYMAEEGSKTTAYENLIKKPVLADLNLYQDDINTLLQQEEKVNLAMEAMN